MNIIEDKMERKFKICIITYPFSNSKTTRVYNLLFDFINLLDVISKTYIITGNIPEVEVPKNINHFINFKMEKELRKNIPFYFAFPIWLLNYAIGQIKMSFNLFKIRKNVDIVIFFLGYDYIFPIIIAKILNKKTIVIATMSSKSIMMVYNSFFYYISTIIEKTFYMMSDKIIVDQQNVSTLHLQRHFNKIIYDSRYVDINKFKIVKPINLRNNTVGYIGRFSEEKGIRNFVDSIILILDRNKNIDINFLIGGDGPLYEEIKKKLNGYHPDKIIFVKWIPHENLPKYLNELKLIVIPSYTETGPFIALEALACGTPILATKVGIISNIIKDEFNGFILTNNLPECIAKDIIRVLNYQQLNNISERGLEMVIKDYNYEISIQKYEQILKSL